MNKLRTSNNEPPSDKSCFALLQTIFPKFTGTKTNNGGLTRSPSSKLEDLRNIGGARKRIPVMLGMMRELLVRHQSTDYREAQRRCLERTVSIVLE